MTKNIWEGKINFFGKEITGPFTIPSGIVCTDIAIIKKIAEIPGIGIITTKSIGLKPKEGNREPIIAQHGYMSFINAVGLTNPGAKEFAKQLSKIRIPDNKFLLISIFGGNEKEFREVAETLYDYADGFEINISCPHSDKYGQAVGQDLSIVERIVKNIVSLGKPVFVKISPNLDVKFTVKCCINAGAFGITAINTKGPEKCLHGGFPVLTNKVGGVSGKSILELGLKCVREAREVTNLPIIACGGISMAEDIVRYKEVGANFFGVGSALAGMNTPEIGSYFSALLTDLKEGTNKAKNLLKTELNMKYKRYKIYRKEKLAEDLFLLRLNDDIKLEPGQFIFAWLPRKGEKPFSVLDDNPLTLLIKKRGYFTNELSKLEKGDTLYVRGPYGNSPKIEGEILLVGGGTGIAGLYLFAKRNKNTIAVLGAKNEKHLPYIKDFRSACEKVYLNTEDGRVGHKGIVTDNLREIIAKVQPKYCINCGPEVMVKLAIKKEVEFLDPENIFNSIDRQTKCGVGLCGSCATPKGDRGCVDGPFINY
jgi:dihydroorotate dehydrogenase subfamily 1